MKEIIITAGDPKGVGFEITSKALNDIGPQSKYLFKLVISSNHNQDQYIDLLKNRFDVTFADELSQTNNSTNELLIIERQDSPTFWVKSVLDASLKNTIHALVTGPISKVESHKSLGVNGHTDLFRKYCKNDLFMCFIGKEFNTLLITDHLPLQQALNSLNEKLYYNAIKEVKKLALSNKTIAVLGINPHAGEQGQLGQEEDSFLIPVIQNLKKQFPTLSFSNPLPGDTAFLRKNWDKYSIFICPFHDIGLTAFKTVHGLDDGIQITLGLPFLRTSVDHGTAFDIFNKDIADYGSMKLAIQYAIQGEL